MSQSLMPRGLKYPRRIGLYAVAAILGSWTAAGAQTTGDRPAPIGARPGARSATTARGTAGASYNRLTSTSRRRSAYASPSGAIGEAGAGGSAANDPFRPYSAQARQSAASPTRVSEGPPPPPRVEPQDRYNYYPGMRGGRSPNANVPQTRRHCTPSRASVMSGSLGGVR